MNTTSRISVAGLALMAAVSSAEAQEGLGTVVCVGSELERMDIAGPVATILEKDVQLVYRAAVDLANRDAVEAGLREQLEQTEVRCAWSAAGDTHVVVLRYTGVVPIDLTIDPDDPRFEGFAVGYGTDWDRAEANARLEARFDTYYDRQGYEVIVREQWNAGVARRPAVEARETPRPVVEAREPPRPAAPAFAPGGGGGRVGERFRDCAACPEMVVVPAGSFMMGSRNQHRVTIGYAFAVGVYEVTFAEWDACVNGGGCGGYTPYDFSRESDRHPVIDVSWEDASAYTAWLSRETGERYRLLSEAEWEYMARAGTQTERYWGDDEADQCYYANGYDGTAHAEKAYSWEPAPCSDRHVEAAPVGSFRANPFGLYDVLGNVKGVD